MTTVQTIVTGAYLRSTNFDAGKLALDADRIAHLSRIYRRIWPLIARARPDQYTATTDLTLTGTPPSVAVPTGVIDLLAAFNAAGAQVNIIPATDQLRRWNLAPAIYRIGMTLRSRADTDDPIAGAVLTVLYLDQPAALTALSDTLDTRWPTRHDQLLVDTLAVYLATKDGGMTDGDRKALQGELQQDVVAFASEFGLSPSALNWLHADAERATA